MFNSDSFWSHMFFGSASIGSRRAAQPLHHAKVNFSVDFIVSWSQPLNLLKLKDGEVNAALEGIIISFTLHSDSWSNTERWSTERHDVQYFRATEQLVQLTEKYTPEREREGRGKRGGDRKWKEWEEWVEEGWKPRCPQNPKKGFVLNDSEENKRFMEVKDSCMPRELMVESLHYLTFPYSMA